MFAAGTFILTPNGLKKIETISNTEIYSYNPSNRRMIAVTASVALINDIKTINIQMSCNFTPIKIGIDQELLVYEKQKDKPVVYKAVGELSSEERVHTCKINFPKSDFAMKIGDPAPEYNNTIAYIDNLVSKINLYSLNVNGSDNYLVFCGNEPNLFYGIVAKSA